jgi:hypothetical protein
MGDARYYADMGPSKTQQNQAFLGTCPHNSHVRISCLLFKPTLEPIQPGRRRLPGSRHMGTRFPSRAQSSARPARLRALAHALPARRPSGNERRHALPFLRRAPAASWPRRPASSSCRKHYEVLVRSRAWPASPTSVKITARACNTASSSVGSRTMNPAALDAPPTDLSPRGRSAGRLRAGRRRCAPPSHRG